MSPQKFKTCSSTEGLDAQKRNKAAFNTAGKVTANRARVQSGRGYETNTPLVMSRSRCHTGVASPMLKSMRTVQTSSNIVGLNYNFVASQSVAKARKSPNVSGQKKVTSKPRSKECSLSGSSASVNALPKQHKKSPGKTFQ
jgi:hypothetical protein